MDLFALGLFEVGPWTSSQSSPPQPAAKAAEISGNRIYKFVIVSLAGYVIKPLCYIVICNYDVNSTVHLVVI